MLALLSAPTLLGFPAFLGLPAPLEAGHPAASPAACASQDGTSIRAVVTSPGGGAGLAASLRAAGLEVLGRSPLDRGGVEVIVTPTERRWLGLRGLDLEVLEVGRPFAEVMAERAAADGVPSGYLDYPAVVAELAALAANQPQLAELVDITARYGTPATEEGRHLYALKISDNVASDEDEPAFLLVSAHHARELVTPVIALDAAARLLSGYGTDPEVRDAVDGHEIWIAPVWNPDGYQHVFTADNLWRKNRRPFSSGTGVDLNRNYPAGWASGCSGSTSPGSGTFKGPAAASEAETATMLAWTADRRFAKVLDLHSRGRETLWGYACPSSPVDSLWRSKAIELSQAAGYGATERPPSADGEHFQWQFAAHGAMSLLTETHDQFQPSYASAVAEAAAVWGGVLWFLGEPLPLTGQITDACSGHPLEATLTVQGLGFTEGEVIRSSAAAGRFHGFLPSGTHSCLVEAPGFLPATVSVQVPSMGGATLDVQLDPVGGGAVNFCPATPNSLGQVPLHYLSGSASVGQNQFTLFVERLPGLQPLVFMAGQSFIQAPCFNGVLCLGRPSYPLSLGVADIFGTASVVVDLSAPIHAQVMFLAGSTWGFQVAYRDPQAGGVGLNLSPALQVQICP